MRVDHQTAPNVTYAGAASGGSDQQQRIENIQIGGDPEMKHMTTIIQSVIIYSQFMETIEPGSFQTNMNKIYKENGLKTVKFSRQTNVSGLKELFRDILKEKTDEEESNRE